ncbi:hypothetical protein CVT25_013297 [Psilocybe cyanescens]|uniref:F-box domain-containing protein n=1 Tax=Psilocybe cyanescens TaxID=93625 RepID=A0A409VVK1_PSICY|nr:hypothetical protein CVT25_013297 [Psilocybe cyanescens]
MPSLTSLPLEPLQHIAFHLVARTPLGPPGALLPLLLVSRHVHAALTSSPALLARIFRLKFDVSAVTRRLFAPHARDLAAQLVAACELLRFLRTAPSPHHIEATSHLDTALLMMLDNDGKNYAQLAHAGIHAFLRAYAHTRLWEGREENEGWPRDSQANAATVWLLWLTVERTHLLAESPTERELAISTILPFVVLPQRYAASYAPPNHFSLPLRHPSPSSPSSSSSSSHTQQAQLPITFRLPNSHKRYPHYLPQRAHSVHHFRAILALTAPPCSIPAKLLFVARRELRPAAVPAHAPPGPGGPGMPLTQDDYRALNSARAAVLPRGAKWDWDKGSAVEVNPRLGAGGVERERKAIAAVGDEESRRWDATFWKMRLCGDYMDPGPLFRPGEVYDPGSMRGLWQGKIYVRDCGAQFNHILHNPVYPSIVNPELVHAQLNPQFHGQQQQQQQHNPRLFSESSLQLVMQPLFLDMQEHHRICMCAGRCSSSASENDEEEREEDGTGMEGGCGIVPTRAPLSVLIRADASVADTDIDEAADSEEAASSTPASASASPAPSHLHPHPEGEAPSVVTPPANPPHSGPNDDVGDAPHAYIGPQSVDLGMCNAWFEGAQGGVVCVPRPGVSGKEGRRDEVVVATGFARPDLGVRGGCPGMPSSASSASASMSSGAGPSSNAGVGASSTGDDSSSSDEGSATASGTTTKTRSRSSETQGVSSSSKSYVYETYDPRKRSSHDVHVPHDHSGVGAIGAGGCVSCARHTEARMVQKRREEEEARRMLDRAMRGFGRGRERGRRPRRRGHSRYSEDEDEEYDEQELGEEEDFSMDMDIEEEEQGEGEEEMQDLDMEDVELGFRFEDVLAVASSSSSSSSSASSGSDCNSNADSDSDYVTDAYPDALDLDLDSATLDTDDLDAFAAHICAPGKKHYVRIVEAEDEDLHTFPLVSAASRNGKGRERLEVLGDDKPRGEDGFVVYTCLSGNGRVERKRKRGQSASPAMAMESERKECSTKRARMNAGASGATMASTSSSSGSDEMLHTNPHVQPSSSTSTHFKHPNHHRHAHATQIVHATRREFDRARIGTACTGTRDILLTGCLPSPSSSTTTQPQYFPSSLYSDVSVYGRVRRWDGLVGMLRMSRAGGQGGGGGAASFLFVFGYVVGAHAGGGGGSFVGEWRIAGSDPMRPSWGGAFVMSRLEEEGEVV